MKELSCVNKWFTLGVYLGVDRKNLQIISQQNKCSQECKREMLIELMKKVEVTWTLVVYALLQTGLSSTAKDIAQKHGTHI